MDATPLQSPRIRLPGLPAMSGRRLRTPLAGLFFSTALVAVPASGWLPLGAAYAAFILGLAALFFALCPNSTRGVGLPLAMAVANLGIALGLHDAPAALYGWLVLQTLITGAALLRENDRDAADLISLLLGLSAGGAAGLGLSL